MELEFQARSARLTAPQLKTAATTRFFERTMIFESTRLYTNLSGLARELSVKKFVEYLKRWPINLDRNPTQGFLYVFILKKLYL